MLVWLLLNVVAEISYWQQRQRFGWIAWDTLSSLMIVFSFYKFFIFMDGIHANNLFQASAFSKGYHGKCAEGWFAWNMCKYFVRMSFKFGKAGLYVSNNVMHCLSLRFYWWGSCFRSRWVNLLNLQYDNIFFLSLINKSLNTLFRVTVAVLEWSWAYSSNSKCLTVGNTFFHEYGCSNFALRKFWRSLDFRRRVVFSLFSWFI